jgi:hypothetical protein
MKVFDAVKKGFGAANKNLLLVLVLFVFNLVWNLINVSIVPPAVLAPAADATTPPAVPPQVAVTALAVSAVFILISIFMQGGALGVVRDYVKEGRSKLASFVSYGAKYYLRLIGLGVLIILLVLIIALIAALIVAATAPLNNVVVTVIAAVVAIAVGLAGIYLTLLLVMSPYSLICDDTGIVAAMKNSIGAVKKAFWKVLLLLVLLVLVAIGIGFLIGVVAGLLTAALPARPGQMVIGVINSLFNGYLGVVMMAAFMTYYMALKER